MPVTSLSRRQLLCQATAAFLPVSLDAAETSSYARRVLEKRPVGYWRLGDKTGIQVQDASGQNRHGEAKGQISLEERGIFDRELNTAAAFDGKSAFIEIPSTPEFSQPTSSAGLSVEAWFRPDVLDFSGEGEEGYVHWLGKGETGKQEWVFRFYPRKSSRPNRISAYLFSPGPGLGSGAYVEEDLKPGKWIHLVATFDPGDATHPKAGVSLYKDGKLAGSPATSPGALYKAYTVMPAAGAAPLRLGTRDFTSFFTGALDEVAIYPRVLTAREVADNFRAGRGG